jgi:hypothetical protein
MAGEFQNAGVAIKTVYPSKALEPMINEEAPFRAKLSKSIPAGGKVSEGDVKFNGILALPQNVAQIQDGDDLQNAGERSEVQFNLRPTIFTATMNIGWLTRKAINSNKSGFNGGEVRRRTEETVGNLGKFIESQYVGSYGNGARAFVETSAAGYLQLRNPEGVKLIRQGMKVSVRVGTAIGTVRDVTLDAIRVASVNPDTRRITLTGVADHTAGATVVPDDILIVTTKASQTITNVFANSLRSLVDDGTVAQFIHGVDRTIAGNEKLKSYVDSNAGTPRDLTEQILIKANHAIREGVGKRPTDMWCGPGQFQKYIDFVAPDRRRAVQGGTYDKSTGYKSEDEFVHYAPGVALKMNLSFDVIPRELFLLSWDSMFHYLAQEMQWVDDDSMLHLALGTGGSNYRARWDSFMSSFENIGCDMPSANGVIRDLKAPDIGDV